VIPVRHPLAVAGSLRRRDGFAEQKSVRALRADVERALQLLNKHIYQADRHTGMLIVLQHDDAKEPAVISSGTYRHERARALTDRAL
jgi:hypothetical protein